MERERRLEGGVEVHVCREEAERDRVSVLTLNDAEIGDY